VEHEFSRARLRSVTGYAKNQTHDLDDCAGMPFLQGCVRGGRPIEHQQWSQELQLLFPVTGRIDTMLAVNFYDSDGYSNVYQFFPTAGPVPQANSHITGREQSAAIFGETTVRLAPGWSVTGGVRKTEDEGHSTIIGTGSEDTHTLARGGAKSDDVSWRVGLNMRSPASGSGMRASRPDIARVGSPNRLRMDVPGTSSRQT
jgi:hypothetical protein